MADRGCTFERCETLGRKYLRDPPQAAMRLKCAVLHGGDARGLLPAVLERVQPYVSKSCRVLVSDNTEDAAVVLRVSGIFCCHRSVIGLLVQRVFCHHYTPTPPFCKKVVLQNTPPPRGGFVGGGAGGGGPP